MKINVGNHRLSHDGTSYQLTRVSKSKKDGSDYLSDYAYYARLDRAVLALLERVMGEGKRQDAETVATLRHLIAAVEDARVAVVEAVGTRGEAGA